MSIEDSIKAFCKEVFYPILHPVFAPIDRFLNTIPTNPWATVCAISLFVTAWIVVGVVVKESYVNRGRPNKAIWTDLRIWTVISTLPHVIVYFYFR